MITASFLLFLSSVCIIIKLRQPLAELGETCMGVVLEVVILQGLELPVDSTLPGCPVQHPPLPGVLGANWTMGQGKELRRNRAEACQVASGRDGMCKMDRGWEPQALVLSVTKPTSLNLLLPCQPSSLLPSQLAEPL